MATLAGPKPSGFIELRHRRPGRAGVTIAQNAAVAAARGRLVAGDERRTDGRVRHPREPRTFVAGSVFRADRIRSWK
jgi:hypothetical protein